MSKELPALPENFSYSAEHEWVNAPLGSVEGATVRVGITAVAADALGEVVYVDLPEVGASVTAETVCGEVESTKSVSDVYSPVSGEITAVNEAVTGDPSLINSDPYEGAWLFEVEVSSAGSLMDAAAYAERNSLS